MEFVKTCVKLKEMANSVNDIRLMATLSGPDAIALELKYHTKCYIDLSNRLRSAISNVQNHEEEVPNNRTSYAVALSELISYMFERKQAAGDDLATFCLADLVKLYRDRILQLGVTDPSGNSREQIMHHAPKLGVELDCFKQERDIILAFKKDVGPALVIVNEYDDAMVVSKAAEILRRQILECKASFEGSFEDSYMNSCTPPMLLNFVSSVSHGTDIKSHMDVGASKPDVALAQLIQFNCFAKYNATAMYQRHSKDREPAFQFSWDCLCIPKRERKKLLTHCLNTVLASAILGY